MPEKKLSEFTWNPFRDIRDALRPDIDHRMNHLIVVCAQEKRCVSVAEHKRI